MKVLDGTVVRLRPLRPEEYLTVHAWYEDPEIVAPFDRFVVETFDEFDRSLASADGDPASLAPRFAIEERASGRLVGVVGHYRAHPVLEYLDVWYLLGDPAARGRGFGREAVGLLVSDLFRSEPVERIGAVCDVENVPSFRLLEGLGFRREGTLRAALFHHGRWHDVYTYGVTRAEWAGSPRRA
jgi:[ribosomal protein S5]-alanine N-acetyltransferase